MAAQQNSCTINEESIVAFVPLSRVREPDGRYYIGREETNTYLHLDEKYAEIIRLCDGSRNIKEVINLYIDYHRSKDQAENYILFLNLTVELIQQLFKYQFVSKINGQSFNEFSRLQYQEEIKKRPILNFLFSDLFMLFCFTLFIFGLAITVTNTSLFPNSNHLFWHPNLMISVLSQFILTFLLLAKHEYFHYLAAKNFGIKTDISMSHRYLDLVVEAKLTNIYKTTRKNRVKIYAAGMASDALFYGGLLIILNLNKIVIFELPILFRQFLQQIILITWLNILWQFRFFLKTDIYAIIEDTSGCDRLHELATVESQYWLFSYLARISKFFLEKKNLLFNKLQHPDFIRIKKRLPWYVWFFIGGILISTFQFFFYQFPITFKILYKAMDQIIVNFNSKNWPMFVEGVVVFFVKSFYLALLFYVLVSEKLLRRKKQLVLEKAKEEF